MTNQNNIASTAFSPNKAPAATAVKIPDLIGSVVQSNAGLNVGIYSINENGLKAIKTDDTMNAGNGGAALDGKYICCLMDQFGGQVYGAYYRVFDMSDWTLIEDNHNADFNLMSECMTSDGSVIYGCFYNIDLSGYELGTMSLTPVKRTGTIRSLAEPYSALACDAEALYGIYGDGRLVKINKSTGEETMLTNIGIVSHYLTSAAYDSKTASYTMPLVPTQKLHFTRSTSTMDTPCPKYATCKARCAACTSLRRLPRTEPRLPFPT